MEYNVERLELRCVLSSGYEENTDEIEPNTDWRTAEVPMDKGAMGELEPLLIRVQCVVVARLSI